MSKIQNLFQKRRQKKDKDDHFIGATLKSGAQFGINKDGFVLGKRVNNKRLPTWSELSRKESALKAESATDIEARTRGGYPTLKFMIGVVCLVLVAVLYVRHVYTTRNLLQEVMELRRANLQLYLQSNRLRANYENIKYETGENVTHHPTLLIEKAKKLGLKEGWEFGQTIVVE